MFLQFASDGNWEEALRLDLPAAKNLLKAWLKNASEDVALELFTSNAAFIGLRLKPFQHEDELMCFCDTPSLESLRELFSPALFMLKPDYAELGVVNAWKSLGSKIIWRQGEPFPRLESIEVWTHSKPIALEFAYNKPIPHWQAYPVSVKTEQNYQLDLELLGEVLSRQISGE